MPYHSSILLIDDSPGECELFRLALQQTGLDVTLYTQQDAEAAWHFLMNHSDLSIVVLLDWHLGKQRGDEFLRRLRADSRFATIPVIIFTTSDDATDLSTAYATGANAYVVKPGTFEELARCTEHLCRFWIQVNVMSARVTSPC
jgi:two-component system, chemotaxis family, response regulator Rcp1